MFMKNKTTMGAVYDFAVNLLRRIYDARISGTAILDSELLFPDAPRFIAAWPQLRLEALPLVECLQSLPRFHELMASQAEISANRSNAVVAPADRRGRRYGKVDRSGLIKRSLTQMGCSSESCRRAQDSSKSRRWVFQLALRCDEYSVVPPPVTLPSRGDLALKHPSLPTFRIRLGH